MVPERLPDVPSSDAKPGKLLRCPTEGCGKVFRSSPGYRYHLKSHDVDPRPHVCQCCHKKFKSANGLKYHLRKAHHIEPVLSKQNLGSTSPKNRDSLSSEEDPYISLNDSYPRNFMNGTYGDRANIPSPLVKSPLGLSSPLVKNLPGIPSPLIKSPLDIGSYMSGGSTGSGLQSPYNAKDKYSHYYDRLNGDGMSRNGDLQRRSNEYGRPSVSEYNSGFNSRSSLSEYTQQCQQANNDFRQQCQRLSTGDLSTPRLPTADYGRASCDYYPCKSENFSHCSSGSYSSDYRHSNDYSCVNGEKHLSCSKNREYTGYKDLATPTEVKDYPTNFNGHSSLDKLNSPLSRSNSMCIDIKEEPVFKTENDSSHSFKIPCSVQNTEQIVPDIGTSCAESPTSCSVSPTGMQCDRNNNSAPSKSVRGASESSNETELSDCVFQNEHSNPSSSPPPTSQCSEMCSIKTESCDIARSESILPPPAKPLLSRRTSRSKSIPPALVIDPSPTLDCKAKDMKHSRLHRLAEIATSPRSPFHHSPLPLTLTPSLIPAEGTPDWIKSPAKFSFPDKPTFLLTPTISRSHMDSSTSDAIVTSGNSLPPSPFLDNIQTPSFWPTQMWPTPVWLCFLKGCCVKFEQDDKEYMTSEDVAAFCTTPGGRRRDDMNYYTSGMKIVEIREKPTVHSAREMVVFVFEQIIPGTQRLIANCPVDHPFYIKHKGWSAFYPTEAMARYGIPFKALQRNDIAVHPPSKINQTPSNAISPVVTSGPQVFTFSAQDTSRFSQSKKNDVMLPPPTVPELKPTNTLTVPNSQPPSSSHETIELTFSAKSPSNIALNGSGPNKTPSSQLKLVNELKSISEAMKSKAAKMSTHEDSILLSNGNDLDMTDADPSKKGTLPRKKRKKPLLGNEKDRRPMNGFMLFAKKMRVELTKLYPGKDNRAISKLLGERWRELSEEKREDYSRMAKEMADERMKLNPDCWKRKHRKDKEGGSKSSSGDGDSPDEKKPKLASPDKEFVLPAAFVESGAHVMDEDTGVK